MNAGRRLNASGEFFVTADFYGRCGILLCITVTYSFRLMHEANLSSQLSMWDGPSKPTERSLKSLHIFTFFYFFSLGLDMAFTSYQKRAIKTLNLALEELDALWIPVTKTWKLNERMCPPWLTFKGAWCQKTLQKIAFERRDVQQPGLENPIVCFYIFLWFLYGEHVFAARYGDLQGLNKAETTNKFGEEQVTEWRRSYAVPPPPIKDRARSDRVQDQQMKH